MGFASCKAGPAGDHGCEERPPIGGGVLELGSPGVDGGDQE